MPELPEVETIARRLAGILFHKSPRSIEVLRDKSFRGDPKLLIGRSITEISRRAKIIRLHFEGNLNLLVHLKMTGQLIYVDSKQRLGGGHPTADWVQSLPSKHTRVVIDLTDKATLFFNDMRVFGWLKLATDDEVQREFARFGPDINDPTLSVDYLYQKFQRRSLAIKQIMMDNAVVCGVGNIYACDALNLARLHPTRPAKSLSEDEVSRLLESAQSVIERGIELGGATIDNYKQVDGFSGKYQDAVLTYGREGKPCFNCGTSIQKMKLGGRGTYFCPECQE
jgi:formamidopyrimidine-DNA glycosylase